jgi:Uma2 family endonuclease
MSVAEKQPMTAEAYLDFERTSLEKHEYHAGEIFAMSGASERHNVIAGNVFAALHTHLKGNRYRAYMSDLKVRLEKFDRYVYPDVVVICGKEAFKDKESAKDATVIVEVLSASTEKYDRTEKFWHYQSLPSLKEYVLVSQDGMSVEKFNRTDGGETKWIYEAFTGKNQTLQLESVAFSIELTAIYDGVEF